MTNVLVVCNGCRWRSPTVAITLRYLRPDLSVRARGLAAREGVKMERPAREYLVERWPALAEACEAHRSVQITPEDLYWGEYLLVMSARHRARIRAEVGLLPDEAHVLSPLLCLGRDEVPDPHMRPAAEQRVILGDLVTGVEMLARSGVL